MTASRRFCLIFNCFVLAVKLQFKELMLALHHATGLNRKAKMNRTITVVPPLATWAWRSPSVKPQASFYTGMLRVLNLGYTINRRRTYYSTVLDSDAIYYDWHQVGGDLRDTMMYYGIDGRRRKIQSHIPRGVEQAGQARTS